MSNLNSLTGQNVSPSSTSQIRDVTPNKLDQPVVQNVNSKRQDPVSAAKGGSESSVQPANNEILQRLSSVNLAITIDEVADMPVIKIFDACSSMHAKALAEEQRVHNGQPGNCGHLKVKTFFRCAECTDTHLKQ